MKRLSTVLVSLMFILPLAAFGEEGATHYYVGQKRKMQARAEFKKKDFIPRKTGKAMVAVPGLASMESQSGTTAGPAARGRYFARGGRMGGLPTRTISASGGRPSCRFLPTCPMAGPPGQPLFQGEIVIRPR